MSSQFGRAYSLEIPAEEAQSDNRAPTQTSERILDRKTLDDLVSNSIDQVLGDVLGRKAKEAIYDYMERNYSTAREDLPKKIQNFITLMEEVCGTGSRTITRCILRRVWQQLGWEFAPMPGFEFQDYLDLARARISRELVQNARVASV